MPACRSRCTMRKNPATGRCVLRSGKIGSRLRGRAIVCRSICNRETGRCRQLTPHPAQRQQRQHSKPTSKAKSRRNRPTKAKVVSLLDCMPQKLEKFVNVVHNCECHKKWKRKLRMGSGANGAAYHACNLRNTDDCDYVLKVQPFNLLAKAELDAYIRLKSTKLTPTLHAAWLCNKKMYLVLDRLLPCPTRPTRKAVLTILQSLEKKGWVHVDTHPGNVMCTAAGKVVLIDFGWAVHASDAPYPNHPACDVRNKSFAWLREIQRRNVEAFFV